MASLPTQASLFLLLTLACGDTSKKVEAEDPPGETVAETVVAAIDAQVEVAVPEREQAEEVLAAFGKALLASPTGAIDASLRIPDGLSEPQLDFFYKELRKKHVNNAGIAKALEGDFGPIAERLGDKAQSVADQLGLSLEETWVFGDVESAAIMQWDGTRFWVAGVHKLRD